MTWIVGGQLVVTQVEGGAATAAAPPDTPPRRLASFGLSVPQFHALAARLRGRVRFVAEPHLRGVGTPGEQWVMAFADPAGNAMEVTAVTAPPPKRPLN